MKKLLEIHDHNARQPSGIILSVIPKTEVMDKDQKEQSRSNEGVGRTNTGNHSEQNAPVRDISHIDRQEGDMDNGELGGNFKEKQQEEPARKPS